MCVDALVYKQFVFVWRTKKRSLSWPTSHSRESDASGQRLSVIFINVNVVFKISTRLILIKPSGPISKFSTTVIRRAWFYWTVTESHFTMCQESRKFTADFPVASFEPVIKPDIGE